MSKRNPIMTPKAARILRARPLFSEVKAATQVKGRSINAIADFYGVSTRFVERAEQVAIWEAKKKEVKV